MFIIKLCCLLGPVGELRSSIAGKIYTIENTIEDCQHGGGDLMVIDYHMVCAHIV